MLNGVEARVFAVVLAALGACVLGAEANERLDALRFKFEVEVEQLGKPLEKLSAQYQDKLGQLAKTYSSRGDLTKTIAARAAAEAGEPEAESLSDQPKEIAQLQRIYLEQKAAKERARTLAHIELQKVLAAQLGEIGAALKASGDLVAADDLKVEADGVIEEIARRERALLIDRPEFEITGKFHSYIDDTCTFYVNGERVFRHGHWGGSWSPALKLKIGDCVLFSVRDYENEKWFRTTFVSVVEDKVEPRPFVVSFRAEDMKLLPGDSPKRVVTREEFAEMEAKPTKQNNGWDAGTPVTNQSEWIWGSGGRVLMATFVTREMIGVGEEKEK